MKKDEIVDLLMNLDNPKAGHGLDPVLARPVLERVRDAHSASAPLPLASGLGTVIFGTPRRVNDLFRGTVHDNGNLADDKWAWPMGGIRPFPHPIPCRGAQGFWEFPKELEPKS
jgi:hypothetical protein